MAFKMFKNLRLFMTVRYILIWQHQATSKGWWASKRLLMEFANHLARNCFCLDYLTEHAGLTEKWLLNLLKGEMVLWGSCFMNDSVRHSAGYTRKWLVNCQYRQKCLWNFCFVEKSARYYGPVDWILMPQQYRRTLGDCSGTVYNALPVYFNIRPFWSLCWSWRIDSYSYNFP